MGKLQIFVSCLGLFLLCAGGALAHTRPAGDTHILSGTLYSQQNELVPGVNVIARFRSDERRTTSDAEGNFRLIVPNELITLRVEGDNVRAWERIINPTESTSSMRIEIELIVPRIHSSVVIVATHFDPAIERRNDDAYENTLFSRDDQLLFTLNAGINAGQHEGGGKSLEVRRFGYNLDHGGVGGGIKILVDDVQQNQGTQGHGQGYLGQLKSLTPELIADVDIINGPFNAQYGDFSGLGVVHIRQKESLPDQLTVRLQGGSFDTFRTFVGYSPALPSAASFIAYEGSRGDGPFLNPLRYRRDNVSGNYTRQLGNDAALGFKLNAGRNNFFSSGQIPQDEVAAGKLDRFGFIDPFNGGRIRTALISSYYRKDLEEGKTLKIDGSVSRSLFDLFSNFTFFLNDPINGDEIQQHDSRLQENVNVQYLHPYRLFGKPALLIAGGNFLGSQINVGLSQTVRRNPIRAITEAQANVANLGGYAQQSLDLFDGRLHLEGGLRFDYFRFGVDGFNADDDVNPIVSGARGATRLQPKAAISYTPSSNVPATFYFNYGRGISSQDARGVVARPDSPGIATTDFYQFGTSHNTKRISLTTTIFLIDQSNQQVYIADDGTFEFAGPSRAYGYELKTSINLTRQLSFNGGITRVANAFFRATLPTVYVDSAPHLVANGSFTLSNYRGFTGSLRYRHTSGYRLDGKDATIRAAGLDVVDFSLSRRIKRWLDFNLSLDNLTNKRYLETQNFLASRLPGEAPEGIERIHAYPGNPFSVTIGFTFRFFGK